MGFLLTFGTLVDTGLLDSYGALRASGLLRVKGALLPNGLLGLCTLPPKGLLFLLGALIYLELLHRQDTLAS